MVRFVSRQRHEKKTTKRKQPVPHKSTAAQGPGLASLSRSSCIGSPAESTRNKNKNVPYPPKKAHLLEGFWEELHFIQDRTAQGGGALRVVQRHYFGFVDDPGGTLWDSDGIHVSPVAGDPAGPTERSMKKRGAADSNGIRPETRRTHAGEIKTRFMFVDQTDQRSIDRSIRTENQNQS